MPDRSKADEVREAWGRALKAERKTRRLWQSEVADMAQLSQGTVSDVENGQGSLDSFISIAKALDVDIFAIGEVVA
jgi:transcriptional regulator with XRE-family HTH domain